MRIILFFFVSLLIFAVGFFYLNITKSNNVGSLKKTQGLTPEQLIDYRASFLIFTNGLKRSFSSPMYHNLSADVYIEPQNPSIVTVKKEGITWDDFFKTLPFKLTKDCLTTGTKEAFCTNETGRLTFYLNGQKDDDLLSKQIQDRDKALITYGNLSEEQIVAQLQQIPDPRP